MAAWKRKVGCVGPGTWGLFGTLNMNGTGFCGFKKIFNGFYLSYFVSCALPVEMSCFLLFNIPAFQERMAELEKEWLAPQFFCVFRRHLSAVGGEACPMQGYVRCRPILSFGGFARLTNTQTQSNTSSASLRKKERRNNCRKTSISTHSNMSLSMLRRDFALVIWSPNLWLVAEKICNGLQR